MKGKEKQEKFFKPQNQIVLWDSSYCLQLSLHVPGGRGMSVAMDIP